MDGDVEQTPHVKTMLQRHAEGGGDGSAARSSVYELYGLTDDEIAVVEGSAGR